MVFFGDDIHFPPLLLLADDLVRLSASARAAERVPYLLPVPGLTLPLMKIPRKPNEDKKAKNRRTLVLLEYLQTSLLDFT